MALFRLNIEWTDNTSDTMVYKYPFKNSGREVNNKSALTVRESQVAIFVHKGKIADIFEPGVYELGTQIFPILTKLAAWKYKFETPITLDVYFVNTKQFTNIKWGTQNPITMRDPEFGVIRVRGYGAFAFKVDDPETFMRELFGTKSLYKTEDIQSFAKTMLISALSDAIGESKISVLDLAGNTMEFNEIVKAKIQDKFNEYGLKLTNLFIENMSVPTEVEKAIDERSRLGVLGDATDTMMKIAAAEAMKEAAKNPGMGGTFASAGVGLGAGMAMGSAFGSAMGTAATSATPAAPAAPATPAGVAATAGAAGSVAGATASAAGAKTCPGCGASVPASAKFCPECGTRMPEKKFCTNCGQAVDAGAKFCPNCGAKQ